MMIKVYRESLGLTQKEMAQKIGISKQSYWNKENGRRKFNDKEKKIIRDIIRDYVPNVTIDRIFFN